MGVLKKSFIAMRIRRFHEKNGKKIPFYKKTKSGWKQSPYGLEASIAAVQNKPSRRRRSPRVPTGFHGRFVQAVFRPENFRFSAFLDAFLRGRSIGASSPN